MSGARTRPPRDRALDGLRGVAAMAVVVTHVVVATNVALSSQFFEDPQPLTRAQWLFAETPLRVLWAGQEWVVVFFVLSGLVLSLAGANGERFDARRYYPARLVRLYVPVWAALVLAGVLHEAVGREQRAGATEWLNLHVTAWSASTTAQEMLIFPGDYYYMTVLWSLRWEVAFSVLLPLYLVCAGRFPLRLLAATSVLAIALGGPQIGVLRYLPAFMLGTALAYGRADVRSALADNRLYALTLTGSPILLTANHWMPGGVWQHAAVAMVAIGAAALVAVAMVPGPFARLLETRPMQLVGRRSFSLYLVHEPILVATAFALGGQPSSLVLAACAAVPVAIATALFYRGVERPSQTLARRLGARTAQLRDTSPPARASQIEA